MCGCRGSQGTEWRFRGKGRGCVIIVCQFLMSRLDRSIFLEKKPIEENIHCGKEGVLFDLGDRPETV